MIFPLHVEKLMMMMMMVLDFNAFLLKVTTSRASGVTNFLLCIWQEFIVSTNLIILMGSMINLSCNWPQHSWVKVWLMMLMMMIITNVWKWVFLSILLTNASVISCRLEPTKGTYVKEWAKWEKQLRETLLGNAEYLNSIQVRFTAITISFVNWQIFLTFVPCT